MSNLEHVTSSLNDSQDDLGLSSLATASLEAMNVKTLQGLIDELREVLLLPYGSSLTQAVRDLVAFKRKTEAVVPDKRPRYVSVTFVVQTLNALIAGEALPDNSVALLRELLDSQEPPSIGEDSLNLDAHFRSRIGYYTAKHPSLLVRQLASRLQKAWSVDSPVSTQANCVEQKETSTTDVVSALKLCVLALELAHHKSGVVQGLPGVADALLAGNDALQKLQQ